MSGGLFALLDDIAVLAKAAAASVDDVAAAAGRASAKAAGVIVDDTAVTPRYVQGLEPKRELPIIKKIAVMRGLIPDPHAEATHHAAGEVMIDQTLLAETGFASADHPATDEMIDHPLDHNRNYTDDDAARETGSGGRPATDTRPNGGPRE